METVIIDAEWEDLPVKQAMPDASTKLSKWLVKVIAIEYACFGLAFGLKAFSTLFISACE